MDLHSVIGNKGGMPNWKMPDDLKFFKEKTKGNAVIMGRKNYESLPPQWRPLPDRTNIVLTENVLWDAENDDVKVVHSFWKALQKAEEAPGDTIWIIGGGQIYKTALEKLLADEIYVTHIDSTFEGDIYFPSIDHFIYTKREILKEIVPDGKNSHHAKITRYWR